MYSTLYSSFEFAFSIAKVALKSKLPEIYLKYALYLEDEVRPFSLPTLHFIPAPIF